MKKVFTTISKNISLALFLLLIYVPVALYFLGQYKEKTYDVELKGYTDSVPDPVLSADAFTSGQFQSDFTTWTDTNLPLRGACIRTYNTINLKTFHVGNGDEIAGIRYIGSDGYVFEHHYLYSQMAMGDWDYSNPERVAQTENMVSLMESIDSKLQKSGKRLYIYIVPSKADLYYDKVPYQWQMMNQEGRPRGVDVFRNCIEKTDLNCRFMGDIADDIGYPTYYQTGIHWTRPYEQIASQTVINDIRDLTGGNFRNIELLDMETSKEPYFRDTDMYDLLNVWTYPDIDYYQYNTKGQDGDFDPLRILIIGDSFSDGLTKDVTENIPEDAINFISRSDFWRDTYGNYVYFGGDYSVLNWQFMLDISDVLVIEMVDVELPRMGYGFLEFMDSYLDTYVAREKYECYNDCYDVTLNRNGYFTTGLNGQEAGFTWTKHEVTQWLRIDPSSGVEVSYDVPLELIMAAPSVTVDVYVNDVLLASNTYSEATEDVRVIIPGELVERTPYDTYQVKIVSSDYFVPSELGIGNDTRELALKLKYIGKAR